MNSHSGIVHNGGIPNGPKLYLSLEELRAKVLIIDVAARVTLTQVFSNLSANATSKAVYYFPIPAKAAICAFEMKTDDGRTVLGISKDSAQARAEYEQAIADGKYAGLLEWITDDIFTISVGSIPAGQTVETKLVFVMSLMDDDSIDKVRLQLPMHVGERYGQPPSDLRGASAPSARTRIRITTEVQTSGRIRSITSPSHSNEIHETQYPTHLGRPSRRRSTIKYRSKAFLERDFVLIVKADGLDEPRCFAELEGNPNAGRSRDVATLAMQLTIMPKLKLPTIDAQEYLFVVDRSGSMENERIETAIKTLTMLLRMLPSQGTVFNIYSFGSHADSFWPQSVAYTQKYLDAATAHVKGMNADYGGTEIRSALQLVLSPRIRKIPTAVFVLTDGEAYDVDATIGVVQMSVRDAPPDAPIRVYVLGIGEGVSSAMCEGIATAGNGVCLFAVTAESIVGKCARLLRAGRTAFVKDIKVDWGVPDQNLSTNTPSVNFSPQTRHSSLSAGVRLQPPPIVQQAPTVIHDIHAGVRLVIFVIIRLKKPNTPKQVVLSGTVADDNAGISSEWSLTVPIRGVQLKESEPGLPLIHTLAASHLIREHDMRLAPLPQTLSTGSTDDELRKAAIVRLGERYQLASRFTSFVAVESNDREDVSHRRRSRDDFGNFSRQTSSASNPDLQGVQRTSSSASQSGSLLSTIGDLVSGFMGSWSNSAPTQTAPVVPGAWPDSNTHSRSSSTERETDPPVQEDDDGGYASESSARTWSTMSSLVSHSSDSSWSTWSAPTPPPISDEDARLQRCPSPKFVPQELASPNTQRRNVHNHTLPIPPPASGSAPPPVDGAVLQVIGLQLCDGSFLLDDSLRRLVGDAGIAEAQAQQVDAKVWATALCVAFIQKRMQDSQKELLDDLLAKPLSFLESQGDARALIERAMELVS